MKKVMLVSGQVDSLIEERYRESLENDELFTVWDTLVVSDANYQAYEDLRLALYELTEEIKDQSRKANYAKRTMHKPRRKL